MSDEEGSSTLHCGVCRYTTDTDGDFIAHYDQEHKKELVYWCRGCSNVVKSPTDLVTHIKDSCSKEDPEFTFECGVANCDFSTKNACSFSEHCRERHKSVLLIPCSNCTRLFTIASFLILHMQNECTGNKSSKAPRSDKSKGTKTSRSSPKDKSSTKTARSTAREKSKWARTKTDEAGGKSRSNKTKSEEQSSHGGSASTSRRLQEESDEELEYFSLYGKKLDPIDLSNIHVVSSQPSTLKFTGPVEDFMKLANFNMRLSVPDVRKTRPLEFSEECLA